GPVEIRRVDAGVHPGGLRVDLANPAVPGALRIDQCFWGVPPGMKLYKRVVDEVRRWNMAASLADNFWLIAVPLLSAIALVAWHYLEPEEIPLVTARRKPVRPPRRPRPAAARRARPARCAPARRVP